MNEKRIRTVVAKAVQVDREIARLKADLDELKEQIRAEAESRPEEQQKTDGGGWSVVFEGDDGCAARVTREGDGLVAGLDGESPKLAKVRAAAGRHFDRLFLQAPRYVPVTGFRQAALDLLGREAVRLTKLVERKGKTNVAFETKEAAA